MKKLILLVVLIALALGAKNHLETKAENMVAGAQQMYETERYQGALRRLDEAEKYLGWTPAVKDSEELRAKIEKRLKAQKKAMADAAEARRFEAEWEAHRRQEEEEWAREDARKKLRTIDDAREQQGESLQDYLDKRRSNQ